MLKLPVFLTMFLTALNAQAVSSNECFNFLFKYQDSHAFKVENIYNANTDTVGFAKKMVILALEKNCDTTKIDFNLQDAKQSGCSLVAAKNPNSLTCYLETNVGFFFITQDFMDNAFVIWNRWD